MMPNLNVNGVFSELESYRAKQRVCATSISISPFGVNFEPGTLNSKMSYSTTVVLLQLFYLLDLETIFNAFIIIFPDFSADACEIPLLHPELFHFLYKKSSTRF